MYCSLLDDGKSPTFNSVSIQHSAYRVSLNISVSTPWSKRLTVTQNHRLIGIYLAFLISPQHLKVTWKMVNRNIAPSRCWPRQPCRALRLCHLLLPVRAATVTALVLFSNIRNFCQTILSRHSSIWIAGSIYIAWRFKRPAMRPQILTTQNKDSRHAAGTQRYRHISSHKQNRWSLKYRGSELVIPFDIRNSSLGLFSQHWHTGGYPPIISVRHYRRP